MVCLPTDSLINRKEYLDLLIRWRERQLIKVVTGVRRCGKSTLFSLYIGYLKKTGVAEDQIISINLEDVDNEHLLDYRALYGYVKEKLCPDKYTYVFVDEVQNCLSYEKAIDSLFIKKNVDIYITGSNAHMLSGELEPLQRISDNHLKFLLTLDDYQPNANYDGIRKMNALYWLLCK